MTAELQEEGEMEIEISGARGTWQEGLDLKVWQVLQRVPGSLGLE